MSQSVDSAKHRCKTCEHREFGTRLPGSNVTLWVAQLIAIAMKLAAYSSKLETPQPIIVALLLVVPPLSLSRGIAIAAFHARFGGSVALIDFRNLPRTSGSDTLRTLDCCAWSLSPSAHDETELLLIRSGCPPTFRCKRDATPHSH